MKQERNIIAEIKRKSQRMEDRNRRLIRRYSSIDNALKRCHSFMIDNGYVGEICVIYHAVTGLELGYIKMSAKGNLISRWAFEHED